MANESDFISNEYVQRFKKVSAATPKNFIASTPARSRFSVSPLPSIEQSGEIFFHSVHILYWPGKIFSVQFKMDEITIAE
jgi:hypothetical protein